MRTETADIVFLDPPFNLGKPYGRRAARADRLAQDEYFAYMTQVLSQATRVLKHGGALYLYHIPRWAIRFASTLAPQLSLRHWIAISMKNGFPRRNYLYPAHYCLLYFTKGEPKIFSRPKIAPSRCRHCRAYVKDYGGYERFVRNGINLSDIWDDISPVRHSKYKHRKSNELPILVLRRVVSISGKRGGLLVDPFAGAGTSLVAAQESKMRYVGGDSVPGYCRLMIRRLDAPTKRNVKGRG